jgi:hypothetical protein
MGAIGGPFFPQAAVKATSTIEPRTEADLFEATKDTEFTKLSRILLRVLSFPSCPSRSSWFRPFVVSLFVHRVLDC